MSNQLRDSEPKGGQPRGYEFDNGEPLIDETTVLIVEDEPAIASAIARRMTVEGWRVEVASDGPSALDSAARIMPDVVILDVMLPGMDGFEVCRQLQTEQPVPVIMLTARANETDMLVGLGFGADDYMTKPFSMRELIARTQAVLRRAKRSSAETSIRPPIVAGDIRIDIAARRVSRNDLEVHLTPTEFDLLVALASAPRTVLSRETLLAQVWDWADASGTRTVDSHVKALRRKLGSKLIRTAHGVGYAFEPPT